VTEPQTSRTNAQDRRREQAGSLQQQEGNLRKLTAEQNKDDFFKQITPLLQPLKSYIKRRLRIAYLEQEILTPRQTSGDILDQVIFRAYENFEKKPENLTLEHWLYQIANEVLEGYLHKESALEKRRKSLERMEHRERDTLEEMPITADTEGEVWLPEDLDDSEYQRPDFTPPADQDNPEQELERREELVQILQALARVPEPDRIAFDLFAIEGFPKEDVAKIVNIPPNEVPRIAQQVRAQVLREITEPQTQTIA
jgi:RNA polymerase sigma factor (sigma-70 family)